MAFPFAREFSAPGTRGLLRRLLRAKDAFQPAEESARTLGRFLGTRNEIRARLLASRLVAARIIASEFVAPGTVASGTVALGAIAPETFISGTFLSEAFVPGAFPAEGFAAGLTAFRPALTTAFRAKYGPVLMSGAFAGCWRLRNRRGRRRFPTDGGPVGFRRREDLQFIPFGGGFGHLRLRR